MMAIYLTGGIRAEFPDASPENTAQVLRWFESARPEDTLALNAANGTSHFQKRHIVQIEIR